MLRETEHLGRFFYRAALGWTLGVAVTYCFGQISRTTFIALLVIGKAAEALSLTLDWGEREFDEGLDRLSIVILEERFNQLVDGAVES